VFLLFRFAGHDAKCMAVPTQVTTQSVALAWFCGRWSSAFASSGGELQTL
jgi:hypothetical protein